MVYLLFHRVSFKKFFKNAASCRSIRYGFYECGFRQRHESIINFGLQNYVVVALSVLYDVEGVFFVIACQAIDAVSMLELSVLFLYLVIFGLGFLYEISSNGLTWQNY